MSVALAIKPPASAAQPIIASIACLLFAPLQDDSINRESQNMTHRIGQQTQVVLCPASPLCVGACEVGWGSSLMLCFRLKMNSLNSLRRSTSMRSSYLGSDMICTGALDSANAGWHCIVARSVLHSRQDASLETANRKIEMSRSPTLESRL